MPVMMVFILEFFLVNVLTIFVIPLAIYFSCFCFMLLGRQCIITNDVECVKEISRAL